MLTQLVRDLMRLGVGLEVGGPTGASFTLPEDEPRRSRAEKAVNGSLPLIRDHRDEFLRVWTEIAVLEGLEPRRCGECKACIFIVPEPVTWAFCESLYCPYRNDQWSRDAKRWRQRSEWKKRQQLRSEAKPIPD